MRAAGRAPILLPPALELLRGCDVLLPQEPGNAASGQALPGRPTPIRTADKHFISGHLLKGLTPKACRRPCSDSAPSGRGQKFWKFGVWVTAVGCRRRDAESDL